MLSVSNISVAYGDIRVLSDVSFELSPGEVIVLLGANGAGKTTLIKTLNSSLVPTDGEVLLDGDAVNELPRREIAKRVAVVAQENETRFPVSVLEFVLSGRFAHGGAFGWESDTDMQAARSALIECELADFENRLMNELSGGERQRVVMARALATGAKILLLDEPAANLDIGHQAMMFKLVRDKCRGLNYSAIVITHDLNLAAEFADEILMLKNGRIAAKGRPEHILTAENIADVFGVNVLLDRNPASGNVRVTNVF